MAGRGSRGTVSASQHGQRSVTVVLLLPTARSWAGGGCKSWNSQLLWLPGSLGSPTLEGHGMAAPKCITFNLQFSFRLAHSTEILTRSKEMCQPFPWALPSLLNYKNSYFPFGSGISLVSNIMHRRFFDKIRFGLKHTFIKKLNSTIRTSINKTPDYN